MFVLILIIVRVLFTLCDLDTAVSFENCYYTFDWKYRAACAYPNLRSSEIIFHEIYFVIFILLMSVVLAVASPPEHSA